MLDQFSRRKKMRLERASNVPDTKRFELILEITVVQRKLQFLNKNFEWLSTELQLARSRRIFLRERIDLASKLIELNQKWRFQTKVPSLTFRHWLIKSHH